MGCCTCTGARESAWQCQQHEGAALTNCKEACRRCTDKALYRHASFFCLLQLPCTRLLARRVLVYGDLGGWTAQACWLHCAMHWHASVDASVSIAGPCTIVQLCRRPTHLPGSGFCCWTCRASAAGSRGSGWSVRQCGTAHMEHAWPACDTLFRPWVHSP